MKTREPYLLLVICILFNHLATFAQTTIQPITGWDMEEKNGCYVLKPEKQAGDTKEFAYEIRPLAKPDGQPLDDWFNDAIDKDLQQSGYSLPTPGNKKNITSNQTIFSFSAEVFDKKGKTWYVTYISYQSFDNQYRLARVLSSPDIKYYAGCMRPVASHFGLLAKQNSSIEKFAGASQASESGEDNIAEVATGKGLTASDIKGFLIHLEYSYAQDGSTVRTYNPYLVLNDGSIYSDPILSPYNLDVNLSREKEPKKWGTWKLKGDAITVNWVASNQTEKWHKNWFWATPATMFEKIEGVYMTQTGKENASLKSNMFVSGNISFNKAGQFTLVNPSGNDNNGNASPSAADFTKRNVSGTYVLNDYSIELRFNNGMVLRRSFYFYLQGKTYFGIGNHAYVPKRGSNSGL